MRASSAALRGLRSLPTSQARLASSIAVRRVASSTYANAAAAGQRVSPAVAAALAGAIAGASIANCEKEESTGIDFPESCQGLPFFGAGVRVKYVFVKVYAVGLYAEPRHLGGLSGAGADAVAARILDPSVHKVIRIVMARDLSSEKYTAAIVEALGPRVSDAAALAEFKALQPKGPFKKDTEIVMDLSGDRLTYMIGGKIVGTMRSLQLTKALADVYYGADPVSPPARAAACARIAAL